MGDAFVSWIKAKGIEAGIAYFENIAMKLAEVEVSWDHEAVELLPEDGEDGSARRVPGSESGDNSSTASGRTTRSRSENRRRRNLRKRKGNPDGIGVAFLFVPDADPFQVLAATAPSSRRGVAESPN
jgi:hypothetical protein